MYHACACMCTHTYHKHIPCTCAGVSWRTESLAGKQKSEKAPQESGDEELLGNTGPELLTAPQKIFIKRLLSRKTSIEARGT